MIPRNELVAVDIDTATRESLVNLFTTTGRSKILVYREDIDNILGYIHVSELFDPRSPWKEKIKPVLYTPENLMANVMMRRLLQQKRSIAIVVDEFGGTAGMLTLEDLVEEIFGDIQDEHDSTRLTMKQLAPGVFEFSGRCEIEAINERFSLEIPESDDYQTLAGYILHTTGTFPEVHDILTLDGIRYEILAKSANRLDMIGVTVPTENQD